jgi:hypothetical protein
MVTHDIAACRKIVQSDDASAGDRAAAEHTIRAWKETVSVYSTQLALTPGERAATSVTTCHRGEQILDAMRRDLGPLPGRSGE